MNLFFRFKIKGAGWKTCSLFCILALSWMSAGCSLTATRPTQEMSNTAAALRAAREVKADTKSPGLYRQAKEWFFKAKSEYRFKNFKLAKLYAQKARRFAERAEFSAIQGGAQRSNDEGNDPLADFDAPPSDEEETEGTKRKPYDYPEEKPILATDFEAQQNTTAPQNTEEKENPSSKDSQ